MPSQKLCRDSPQREEIRAIIPGRALLDGRYDSCGDTDQERDDDGHRCQLHRYRQLLRDQFADRYLVAQRLAEIARQHALDPVDILHRHRLIEPVLLADLRDDIRVAFLARHDQRRIARQQLLQREDQHRHEEQRRDELDNTPGEKIQHGASRAPVAIPLTSTSARSRAPARPASACSLRALWCARSGCGGDRDRAGAFPPARPLRVFRRSPCAGTGR
jgi:hypothetical protein